MGMSFPPNKINRSSYYSESGPSSSKQSKRNDNASYPPGENEPHLSDQDFSHYDPRVAETGESTSYGPHRSTADESHRRRRYQSDQSGGFLLNTIGLRLSHGVGPQPRNITGCARRSYTRNADHAQGKADSLEGDGSSSRKGKAKAKETIGRSPLGIEVMSPEDPADGYNTSDTADRTATSGLQSRRQGTFQRAPLVFGADQAQIVSLALNLSENRRRQFSTGRFSPGPNGSLRAVSSGALSPIASTKPTIEESLRQRIKQERLALGNSSHTYEKSVASESPRDFLGTRDESSSDGSSLLKLLPVGFGSTKSGSFYPSEATLLRVEKAKTALELSYEYRRLLQFLPKPPAPQDERPPTAKFSGTQPPETFIVYGRPYNPLQYVRNRKLRGRERNLLNTEAEGWKDVDAVRDWVDSVADQQRRRSSSSAGDFMLPPCPAVLRFSTSSTHCPGANLRVSGVGSTARELRPRIDWMMTPWDMLADAYWLEQAGNKVLIEDHKGRRVYSSHEAKAMTFTGGHQDIQHPLSRRSLSLSRSIKSIDHTRKPGVAAGEKPTIERGRPRHQRLDSFTSLRDYSSSQDRRHKWRPQLMRSRSPSSSEESGAPAEQQGFKYMNSAKKNRDRRDKLILEKQVMRLIAKEAEAARHTSDEEDEDEGLKVLQSRDSEKLHENQASVLPQDRHRAHIRPTTPPERIALNHEDNGMRDRGTSPAPKEVSATRLRRGEVAINISPPGSQPRRRSNLSNSSSAEPFAASEEARWTRSAQGPLVKAYQTSAPNLSSVDNLAALSPRTDSSMGHLSPQSAGSFHRLRKPGSGIKHTRSKESKDFESRLKGLLKGTKIADFVSHPVAKVGNFIWKNDISDGDVFSSSASYTPNASDHDESVQKETAQSAQPSLANNPANGSGSRPDLPVFRSPFRGKENGRQHAENVSLQSSPELREGREPDRFAQNAPPPLDLGSIFPSPVGSCVPSAETSDKSRSIDRGRLSSFKRDQSPEGKPTQRRGAIANNLSDPPRHEKTFYKTAIEPKNDENTAWPVHDPLYYIYVTERLLSPLERTITDKDYYVLRALNESAATVSSIITQQVLEVRNFASDPAAPCVLALGKGRGPNANAQAKLLQAQATIINIRSKGEAMTSAATMFTSEIMPPIVERINSLEHKISAELTPLVRNSGSDADQLSSELATTRTLELRRLNDKIDLFARRKRRRFRWLRRGVYLLLEWTLLGMMWWAWLIVVVFKILRGSVRGFVASLRWLFWL
ncbi:MAG: hypothetical protein LQ340_000139 [Diploschistes diacapsis]|nr:MAG: hypothetical protein LQ340_000139 [Diploschistes diacapsis]